MTELTGIVLAGGRSSRMGTNKGLMPFNGIALVNYSLNLLGKFCKEILISANNEAYQRFGYPVIVDEYPDKGPAGGLYSGLKASRNDWNIVISCDVPFINEALIEFIISAIPSGMGVVPVYEKKAEPLIAIYHKSFLPLLQTSILTGDLKMQSIIKQTEITLLDIKPVVSRNPGILTNINFPEDIAARF